MRKNFVISILLITGLLGYLMVSLIDFETAQQQRENEQNNNRNSDLVEVITNQEAEIDQLETAIEELRLVIDGQREYQSEDVTRLSNMRNTLENNRYFAGLTPLEGPGMVVVLNDNTIMAEAAKKNLGPAFNPNDYLIHDKTLLYLINELKAARPEGIAINGQRLVTSSNIRCVGTVVLVNDTRLSPPYEVTLIGDRATLETALKNSEEYQLLVGREFPVSYAMKDLVELPRFRGNYNPNLVRPYPEIPEENAVLSSPTPDNQGGDAQ